MVLGLWITNQCMDRSPNEVRCDILKPGAFVEGSGLFLHGGLNGANN
jgi:hypothetical protein